jgi:PAS domain S-box-containing protein
MIMEKEERKGPGVTDGACLALIFGYHSTKSGPSRGRAEKGAGPDLTASFSQFIFLNPMLGQKRISSLDLILALVLGGLYLTSLYSYILFHSLAEILRIAVAVAIFMLVWNVRQSLDNSYLKFVSIAYVFICSLDIIHTFSHKEMGVFLSSETNLTIQLWTSARYLECGSLLLASFFLGRKLKSRYVLAGYSAASLILLGTIFYWRVFPACFIQGAGLTPFKKMSNGLIALVFVVSISRLVKKRDQFDPTVLRLLVTSIAFTILSELCLSFHVDVYGVPFLLGHLFKIISFYYLYKTIIETGLAKPLAVLFRNLKLSEEGLSRAHNELEIRVQQRTNELAKANELLMAEVDERRRIEEALRESETKYRTVADNTYDWEWWRDPQGNFVYVSPSCRKVTHHEPGEFVADPDLLLRIIHPDDRLSFINHQTEVEGGMTPGEIEFRILRPDGSVRWLAHACQPVFDEQGHVLGRRGSNRDATERKRVEESLRESEQQLRHLSSQILTAQETERRRISRELHDELGGALAVLKLRTSHLEKNLREGQVELREECQRNLKYIDEIIENTRRLSRDLSPSILEDIGLTSALRWLIDNFINHYKIKVASGIVNVDHLFPKDSQIMIYRVFQEALTNIGKHAQASNVTLNVQLEEGRACFFVEDDGRGYDVKSVSAREAPDRGMGLATMKERARMLGGSLDIWSEAAKGTRIALRIPISKEEGI